MSFFFVLSSSPWGDVHPRYKQEVGSRLAAGALNVAYGMKDVYYMGPYGANGTCKMNSNTAEFVINFGNVGSEGLMMKNAVGFEYYNSTGKAWVEIKRGTFDVVNSGKSIGFSLDGGKVVTGIRYDWYMAPCMPEMGPYNCAIYDKKSMYPAGPFVVDVDC